MTNIICSTIILSRNIYVLQVDFVVKFVKAFPRTDIFHRVRETAVVHCHPIHFHFLSLAPFSDVATLSIISALVDTTYSININAFLSRIEQIALAIHGYSFHYVYPRTTVLYIVPVFLHHLYFRQVQHIVCSTFLVRGHRHYV